MADYRIVCTEQVPAGAHPTTGKIVAVGTSSTGSATAEQRWTVDEVVGALDAGHHFYVYGLESQEAALVIKYWCRPCGVWHIRSAPDAVLDNNLDSLRFCSWKAA